MSEVTSLNEGEKALLPKNYSIPVKLKDISIFDGAYTFMKERFTEEMRSIEDEMVLFSKNLLCLRSDAKTYHANVRSEKQPSCYWETLANSPLVEGEGENKTLRLQFDVSQFEPGEITVNIVDNTLVVTAQHVEKSDANLTHNQYHREFTMPSGVDPECVESVLSKDGVLTVTAPLNLSGLTVGYDNYM